MTNTLEITPLSSNDRREASAWYQFIRCWRIEQEHIPKAGWRVSQQNYVTLGKRPALEHDTQNMFVVNTMVTPDNTRWRPYEVLAVIQSLPLEQRLILEQIRFDRQSGGRGGMPVVLFHPGVSRPSERFGIARACLALRDALKKH